MFNSASRKPSNAGSGSSNNLVTYAAVSSAGPFQNGASASQYHCGAFGRVVENEYTQSSKVR